MKLCGAVLVHMPEHPFLPLVSLGELSSRHHQSDLKAIEEPPSLVMKLMGFIFKMEQGYCGALTFFCFCCCLAKTSLLQGSALGPVMYPLAGYCNNRR